MTATAPTQTHKPCTTTPEGASDQATSGRGKHGYAAQSKTNRSAPTAPAGSVLGFALTWSLMITGLAGLQLFLKGEALSGRTLAVALMFLAGSFLGAIFARCFAGLICRWRKTPSARFASLFIGLSVGTAGLTAFIHYLHFSAYYAQWHGEFGSLHRLVEIIMTGASSAYIFTVQGMQLLLPWGLTLLFAAAWDYARSSRTT
ncbi:hypothetical protein [Labrenzia sp. CE80]|uniref:hypothetical protein n=1 Tax=Labrenzia sp. CE80 TaxID=1788986 RepID=UPI00129A261A|nr:hypothetical protein [Labrenzia sp. CE80]